MMEKSLVVLTLVLSTNLSADVDLDMVNRIREHGFYNSQVMDTLQYLSDVIGPRLSGSPQLKEANEWTRDQLVDWGLENGHLEGFDFGRGWSYQSASIDLISPRQTSFHGIPVAWTPATKGTIEAEVIYVDAVTANELVRYRGQLRGKIVLLSEKRDLGTPDNDVFVRRESSDLTELTEFDIDRGPSHSRATAAQRDGRLQRYHFRRALSDFLSEEGAIAGVMSSSRDGGLIDVFGFDHRVGSTFSVPTMIIEAEQYNMIMRLIDLNQTPTLRMNLDSTFHDDDTNNYNTIAEIPGEGNNPEIVMVGAHLDSWHASTGSVDNGAGVAITMEAIRILAALDIKPKRTIRIALWAGEEQGLHGSYNYVKDHFVSRPKPIDETERALPRRYWSSPGWPIEKKSEYDKLSAYFNIDNGSGRIRGIYTEGNAAVKPLFKSWFGPFSDLAASTITLQATGGTDHESFDDVGLPGFQFIQDRLDYMTRLHHTHIDSFDHVMEDDVIQASTILAHFLYQAAMMDDRIPREPIPTGPSLRQLKKAAEEAARERRNRERTANRNLDTNPN
ncbi:MAG: M20/M25/M40 family metallo-hydrolase [Verrucomicrobia bacterium]|nr:M20/M25/M40 family metallo-hydrolase [Verrucomicrobiota bacterium]